MTRFGDETEIFLRFSYDQLHPSPEFLKTNFKGEKWQETIVGLRQAGIDRIMPASENGVRNLAVSTLSEVSSIPSITVPGSERELSYQQYLRYDKKPDPIAYQSLVAASKHARVSHLTMDQVKEMGVVTEDRLESRTLSIGFDTIILSWDKTKYKPLEKPQNEDEAIQTIMTLATGVPFLVSTVARVQNLMSSIKFADSATIIPVSIKTDNRFDRAELINKWIDLYRQINSGDAKPWKVTPAGPSLMHPEIQKYVQVSVGSDMGVNILPDHFTTIDYVDTKHLPHKPQSLVNIGDLAYKRFAERIARKVGYRGISDLPVGLRHKVGMVFSGYSDEGMQVAMNRYSNKVARLGESYYSYMRPNWDTMLLQLLAS